MTYIRIVLFIFAAALLTLSPIHAQSTVLKPSVRVDTPFITLGDVLLEADKATDSVVAAAPEPGGSARLAYQEIAKVLEENGLPNDIPNRGFIIVERDGEEISADILSNKIESALFEKGYDGDFKTRITSVRGSLYLASQKDFSTIQIKDLDHDERSNRFSATVEATYDGNALLSTEIAGIIEPVTFVPVLASAVAAGELVTDSNIEWVELPERRINRTMIRDETAIIGSEAVRRLQPGRPLRSSELREPLMVEKGTLVTMSLKHGALSLTAVGKAMQDGARGDLIRLINTNTNRIVEAQVSGPGRVSIPLRETVASR